ncbi:MAG: ribonuclease PH [Dehalococcoidia bacterium]|nr:ribonuclease PH [Dehalococcoidia bacterium]
MRRIDGRSFDALRNVSITTSFQSFAEGSVLIELGKTRVCCSVSLEEKVPMFLKGRGSGWVTAEYSMLPRSTLTRSPRDATQGKVSGRSHEIQRLIGRALRAVTDLPELGERSLMVDCDVLQADGGTRTAAITGAYVALYQALQTLAHMGIISSVPLNGAIAATSVGIVRGNLLLDLCYEEDCNAEADFNVAMTDKGEFVEVQGTGESKPFSRESLDEMLRLAQKGIKELFVVQQEAIERIKKM